MINSQYTPLLLNEKITYEAKGLGLFLLSRPEGYEIKIKNLVKKNDAGAYKVRRMMNELIEHGYVSKKALKSKKGRFTGYNYHLNKENFGNIIFT